MEGTARDPGVKLLLSAVPEMDIAERPAMFEPTVGHEFEERRAPLVANVGNRLCGSRVDRLDQLTVVLRSPDAMSMHQFGNGAVSRLPRVEQRVHRIEIVLANEEHGQPMDCRKVYALMKDAGLGRCIAEENDRDAGAILQHRAEGRTNTDRDRTADNRHATEKVHRQVDEMHRAALARGAAVDLAVELGEHRAQAAALTDVMGVRTMRANDVVFEAQMPAHACGDGLLTNAEMRRTAHVAFGVERLDAFLDTPNF